MLMIFSITIKIVLLLNSSTCFFKTAIGTYKTLTKFKLPTNPKLTCTQIIKNLKEVG
jgi:hypothetical protein